MDSRFEKDNIDREFGSGSLTKQEGWIAKNERDGLNDGRGNTRTTLYYTGKKETEGPPQKHRDPSDRRTWEEFAMWNDGMWSPDRSVQNFEADVRRWTQTFCNYLDLPDYQYKRVDYVVDDIDLSEFGPRRISAEKVILGVISLVVDSESDTENIEDWDIKDWIVYDDEFGTLMRDVGMVGDDDDLDRKPLWEIRKIVQRDSDYFEE